MTTFQKINRRRWPTWARMTLLALAAAMAVVLVVPRIAESGDTSESGITPVAFKHVGGDAVNDCAFAESEEGESPGFISAYAFSANPAQDSGLAIAVEDEFGVPLAAGYAVTITSPGANDPDQQNGQSFDWELTRSGELEPVQSDGGLVAPKGKNLSHVSFCLTLVDAGEAGEADDVYTVAYVEVKGSRDTNHYSYLVSFDCGQTESVASEFDYDVTLNCVGDKDGATAGFLQFDTNDDDKADTIALISFGGGGTAFYVEHLSFEAQASADINDVLPFVLNHDDTAQDGTEPVVTPQCLFNPDLAADGVEDGLVETDDSDPDYAGYALPLNTVALPWLAIGEQHTTCYFNASFEQTAEGLWVPTFDLLNEGDGWRTIY